MARRPPTADLSRRERQVMEILHRRGESTVAEISRPCPTRRPTPRSGRFSGSWARRP